MPRHALRYGPCCRYWRCHRPSCHGRRPLLPVAHGVALLKLAQRRRLSHLALLRRVPSLLRALLPLLPQPPLLRHLDGLFLLAPALVDLPLLRAVGALLQLRDPLLVLGLPQVLHVRMVLLCDERCRRGRKRRRAFHAFHADLRPRAFRNAIAPRLA